MLRVGINGFGRIGRAIFRINAQNSAFRVVAVNDINPDIDNWAYMLRYDSFYGTLKDKIAREKNGSEYLIAGEERFRCFNYSEIDKVPWSEEDVDVIIDASGIKQNRKSVDACLKGSVKKYIYTNAEADVDLSLVFGVNEKEYNNKKHNVISSTICDAIAFTPLADVINREYGINHCFLTTLHPWLGYQNLLDGPSKSISYPGTIYGSYELGRATTEALIPKPTTVGEVSERVLPFLKGKVSSYSYRVPTPVVCSADITLELSRPADRDSVNELFRSLADKEDGVFGYNEEPLISKDFMGAEYSLIVDGRWTSVMNSKYLKLVIWYDNEWGYSNKVVELVKLIGRGING